MQHIYDVFLFFYFVCIVSFVHSDKVDYISSIMYSDILTDITPAIRIIHINTVQCALDLVTFLVTKKTFSHGYRDM